MNLVSATTVDLWKKIKDQEQQIEIETAIRSIFEPPVILAATRKVQFAMDEHRTANPSKSLLDLIDKRHQVGMARIKQETKKEMRKDYLSDPKSQGSMPTKNALKSGKTSIDSTSASKKQRQKKSQPKTAVASEGGGIHPQPERKSQSQES